MKEVQSLQAQNRGKVGLILPLLGCILLLAGCQNKYKWASTKPDTAATAVKPSEKASTMASGAAADQQALGAPTPTAAERGPIALCQSELASLQKINPAVYAAKKASFDNLVRNASVYTSVRGDINIQTKDTLDALYKYKTNQMCGDIERAVMDGLIRRGESVK